MLKLPSLTILAQATTQHGDSESCIGGSAVTQRVSIDSALVYGDRLLASGGIAKEGCSARTPTLDLLVLWIGVETSPLFSSSASVLPTPLLCSRPFGKRGPLTEHGFRQDLHPSRNCHWPVSRTDAGPLVPADLPMGIERRITSVLSQRFERSLQ